MRSKARNWFFNTKCCAALLYSIISFTFSFQCFLLSNIGISFSSPWSLFHSIKVINYKLFRLGFYIYAILVCFHVAYILYCFSIILKCFWAKRITVKRYVHHLQALCFYSSFIWHIKMTTARKMYFILLFKQLS